MQRILLASIAVIVAGAFPLLKETLNVYLMGFFRDVARIKARKRRMGGNAVISMSDIKTIVFDDEEDPLRDVVDQIMSSDSSEFSYQSQNSQDDGDQLPVYTREELYEFGNGENGVILLSIFGRIYDVSKGEKHYGKDGKYHKFAGRDVTRSLSTGCLQEACLGSMKSSDSESENEVDFEFNEKTMKEAKKWVAFFEVHDTYSHIGFLKDGKSIEHLIDIMVEEETASISKSSE